MINISNIFLSRLSCKMSGEANKRLSVERIYQKKSQREHILLRPDTYIGSVQPNLEAMWVYDEGEAGMNHREINYVPGFYKIFDEILVNAADNKQRDSKMDVIKIEINTEKNVISIMNNGRGIPVELHKEQNMYVPTMIFGHLLTSSNFDDKEAKTTGGRNGFGAKLCNVFSKKFTVETADKNIGKSFKQTWSDDEGRRPRVEGRQGRRLHQDHLRAGLGEVQHDRPGQGHRGASQQESLRHRRLLQGSQGLPQR